MAPDFFDLGYLSRGSAIQQRGFSAITTCGVMNMLKGFDPVVVGTLPLDLFTDKSDIDIICYYSDIDKFRALFHHSKVRILNGVQSVIANFDYDCFEFEVVGQPVPVSEQVAYRHMVVEWKVLSTNGKDFKDKIISLKNGGMKTEPAFAQMLNLEGDPYEALLNYL